MPRTDTDVEYAPGEGDPAARVLTSTTVVRPIPAIDLATYQQARATLRTMVTTFAPGGVPTGTPTNVQIRNWLLALTAGLRYVYGELDNE